MVNGIATAPPGDLDPFLPHVRADPYPVYANLRDRAPVHRSPAGGWLVSRHDDVDRLLRDPRLTRAAAHGEGASDLQRVLRHWLLNQDGPPHRHLRGLVGRHLTPAAVERYGEDVDRSVGSLLSAAVARGPVIDIVNDVAYGLPVLLIGQVLGIPEPERAGFLSLSRDIAVAIRPAPTPAQVTRAEAAATEAMARVVGWAPAAPEGSLLSRLAERMAAGECDADELVSTCLLLFAAGHETTMHLIGTGTRLLLQHPDQLAAVRADRGLLRTAVEEMLRIDSMLQMVHRVVTEDIEMGGAVLRPGQLVVLLLAAANTDPRVFPAPEDFDITRWPNRHLAFGVGHHLCPGASLARMSARRFFDAFLDCSADPYLVQDSFPLYESLALRGLKTLRVRVR